MYISIYIHWYACDVNRFAQAPCVSAVGVLEASGLTCALIAATFGAFTPAYMPTLHSNLTSAHDIQSRHECLDSCPRPDMLPCALDAAVHRDVAVSSVIAMRPFAHLRCARLLTCSHVRPTTHSNSHRLHTRRPVCATQTGGADMRDSIAVLAALVPSLSCPCPVTGTSGVARVGGIANRGCHGAQTAAQDFALGRQQWRFPRRR